MTTETAPAASFAPTKHCADLSRDEALTLYRDMVLGRRFEDKCAEMYYRGKMFGFVHLYNGQEAVSTGVIKAMKAQHDWFCSTYRDHVHALSAGVPAREVMSELFGKETGCSKGRGGSMHLFSKEHHLLGGYAFIGEGIPVALGAAFTSRYKRDALGDSSSNAVTAAFFGDGTCNIGQFYECLNMAQLWKLPILFVVENNKWAIGMAHHRATSDVEIWRKAAGFGMHGEEVDGMDVLAVRDAAQRAIERARAGEGPTLLECMTYRFRGHSLADPDELRDPDEKPSGPSVIRSRPSTPRCSTAACSRLMKWPASIRKSMRKCAKPWSLLWRHLSPMQANSPATSGRKTEALI